MKRSHSSRQWLRRHVNDPYVQRSKREGYRSRSAYKLACRVVDAALSDTAPRGYGAANTPTNETPLVPPTPETMAV